MKYILLLALLLSTLNANIFDFIGEKNAQDSYNAKDYKKSSTILNSLSPSDSRYYNMGNGYYKDGQYALARDAYGKAKSVDKATISHNIGNCFFKENKLEEAIKSYEQSLKIRYDKDTKFNLDLAKKKSAKSKKNEPKNDKKQEQKQGDDKQKQNRPKSQNRAQNRVQNEQEMQNKKELNHIMKKLEEKKMPTMMYKTNKERGGSDEKNPW